ncbi:MAG: hypothetical protein AAF223_23525 [Bacteroidota bacterium]
MNSATTPHWDQLVFSIKTQRLSIQHPTQPLKYLKVTITEHTTGYSIVIAEYPCRYDHTPGIEELLKFLYHKARIYQEARYSGLIPSQYLMQQYRLTDRKKADQIYLDMEDCYHSLRRLIDTTGITLPELHEVLDCCGRRWTL